MERNGNTREQTWCRSPVYGIPRARQRLPPRISRPIRRLVIVLVVVGVAIFTYYRRLRHAILTNRDVFPFEEVLSTILGFAALVGLAWIVRQMARDVWSAGESLIRSGQRPHH